MTKDLEELQEHPTAAKVRTFIKAALGVQGISKAELARRTGISYSTLRDHLDGKGGGVSMDDAARCADALGYDLVAIITGAEQDGAFTLPPKSDLYVVQGEAGTIVLSFDDINWCSGSPRGSHLTVL